MAGDLVIEWTLQPSGNGHKLLSLLIGLRSNRQLYIIVESKNKRLHIVIMLITLRQWSPQVKAATICYYCNHLAPGCTWQRTYIQETGESPRTAKAQTIRAKICSYSWFYSTYISAQYSTSPDYFVLIPNSSVPTSQYSTVQYISWLFCSYSWFYDYSKNILKNWTDCMVHLWKTEISHM